MHQQQLEQVRSGRGFIAALDQSGGSTPKALAQYGIPATAYGSQAEMFDLIHAMRARIVDARAFSGEKVVGAILFEMTMEREFGGKPAALALWDDHHVVPFLKIDKGLEAEADGVQLMKPIDGLVVLLTRAVAAGIFGTKARSVIGSANARGVDAIVAQQFALSEQIRAHGLVPILEPEVTINIPDKAMAETLLRDAILRHLDALPDDALVMLKLTLPEAPNHYLPLAEHPRVLRVVALSGGYSRDQANARLAQNRRVIASFSRALTKGLSAGQSDADFNAMLAETIDSIFQASAASA